MNLRRRRGRAMAVVVATVAIVAAGTSAAVALAHRARPISARDVRIPVVDGPRDDQHVLLDATFYLPQGGGRVPAVLLAHGLGETKDAVRPQAQRLARGGFAVLAWSARGFGRSTGQVALDSPDYEVKDLKQLVTWLAHQPRVRLDRPGDPRVGIAGASYGGGIALLGAAYDSRVDAIVPQITWNNLATALLPNATGSGPRDGVFKKQWAGLLFAQGAIGFGGAPASVPQSRAPAPSQASSLAQAQALAPLAAGELGGGLAQCGRFIASICALYQQMAATGRPTAQAVTALLRSSPASVASRIRVPTLLIQGLDDSLFGLDQADANFTAIRRNGAPVDLVWFDGGHDGGDQESARLDALTMQWFDRWLKPGHSESRGAGTGQPGFAVTRVMGIDPTTGQESLRVATAAAYRGLDGTRRRLLRLAGPPQIVVNPPGGSPPSMSAFPGLGSLGPVGSQGGGPSFDMPGQSAAFGSAPLPSPIQLTGAPAVSIRVSGAAEITLFAKLYDIDQAGNAALPYGLAAPLRVDGATAGRVVTVRLPATDYRFAAGHRLRLVLTTTDLAYATSGAPAVYQVALVGSGVTLPYDPGLRIRQSAVPWWAGAAPAAAIVAAVVLLVAGRRRTGDTAVPDLAGVPLEITGLTKRFGTGPLVIDDLSLRVERGQILGLLGPNGAGKTTTLRALMGLIYPDAGNIAIFGHRVRPGAPVLSRLGSFVEGPGFLPHLSGRANLRLYWRATGRPDADAHLPEVLEIAGLGAAIERPVRAYSRGMRQRLAIAQAMLGMPDLLVLDEPMNGLDPPQIREMRDVLISYAKGGRTVVLSSHMLAEVEQTCTHVVVMHLGRRIAGGAVSEIIGDGGALLVGTPDAARAVAVLGELDGIEGAEPRAEGVLVHCDGLPASAVVAALVGAGIPVNRVTPSRRLEDAFLALIPGVPNHGVVARAAEPTDSRIVTPPGTGVLAGEEGGASALGEEQAR